jgi:hypothetical protein
MKAHEFDYMKQLANNRIAEKQNRLSNLKMIYKFNCYDEFGYTKEEIEKTIKELEEYIYIATH